MAKRPVRNLQGKNKKLINSSQNRKPVKTGGIKKRFINAKVQDARTKLIQKKRSSVKDARDILANMAKSQDARSKLNKLRQRKKGVSSINSNIKVIGTNILQKTDHNGKISLVTNKPKVSAAGVGISTAIKRELGLGGAPKKMNLRRTGQSQRQQISRQEVIDAIDVSEYALVSRPYDPSVYKWPKPAPQVAASQLIGSLEVQNRFNEMENMHSWSPLATANLLRRAPSQGYMDLDAVADEEMPIAPVFKPTISLKGSTRISNIHSRLDSAPMEPKTHGILAQTKTKVVVPAGHRIVVSNLQSTVTQDDVKELFEDIGQLLAARLVRPGVAEVIYKNLKDAQKAVDTYHNRQLDGQPMKCLLVNKRPLNNPTAPPLTKMDSQGILSKESANSNKLIPDLSTIHKVLFQRK